MDGWCAATYCEEEEVDEVEDFVVDCGDLHRPEAEVGRRQQEAQEGTLGVYQQ